MTQEKLFAGSIRTKKSAIQRNLESFGPDIQHGHLHPNRVHLRLQELVTSLLPAPLRSMHLLKHICHVTPGLQTLSRKVSADAELYINASTKPAVADK